MWRQFGLDGASTHSASGDCTFTSLPPIFCPRRSQLASEGHSGSVGRTRDKGRVVAADDLEARSHDHKLGMDEINAPTICNRRLLFIQKSFGMRLMPGKFLDSKSSCFGFLGSGKSGSCSRT